VRQHDRVHLGVRQIESAAEHVAELVVQRRAGDAKSPTPATRTLLSE